MRPGFNNKYTCLCILTVADTEYTNNIHFIIHPVS